MLSLKDQNLKIIIAFTLGVIAAVAVVGLLGITTANADFNRRSAASIVPNMMDQIMGSRSNMMSMMDMMSEMNMSDMTQMMNGCLGMMGPVMGGPYEPKSLPVTFDRAVEIAKGYVASRGDPNLELLEVEEWANNFYFNLREKNSGTFTDQILIDKYTGSIHPEPGANMMWKSRKEMAIDLEKAKQYAEQFLTGYLPGSSVDEGLKFYGYYHFQVLKDGKRIGMLDVNGFTGEVWFHMWLGPFIQEEKV